MLETSIYFGSQSEKNTSPYTTESKKKTQQTHLFFPNFPSPDKVFMLWSYITGHHIKQGTNLKQIQKHNFSSKQKAWFYSNILFFTNN